MNKEIFDSLMNLIDNLTIRQDTLSKRCNLFYEAIMKQDEFEIKQTEFISVQSDTIKRILDRVTLLESKFQNRN